MAPFMGTSIVSIFAILPSFPMVKRSIGSLSWGETMRRPWLSTVNAIQEPSPGCELRTSSTLKPSATLSASAGVAPRGFLESWASAGTDAPRTQSQRTNQRDKANRALIIIGIAVRRFVRESLQTTSARQGVFEPSHELGRDGAR